MLTFVAGLDYGRLLTCMRYSAVLGPRVWRLLASGIALLVLLMSGGCSPAESSIPVYADPSMPVEVGTGEQFVISLSDDPTNGLMWEAEYDEGLLQLVSEELVFPEDRDCTRCSWGYYQFTFDAVAEGAGEVAVAYRRPGFPADTDEVRTFGVVVSPQ